MPRTYQPYSRSNSRKRLAGALIDLRLAWAWRQGDMARHLGVSVRTIQRLERGELEPVGALATLLHIVLTTRVPPNRKAS